MGSTASWSNVYTHIRRGKSALPSRACFPPSFCFLILVYYDYIHSLYLSFSLSFSHTHTHFSLVLFNLKQRFTAQWRETRLRKDTSKLKSMGLVSWGANGLYKRAVYLLECFRYIAFYNANSHVLCWVAILTSIELYILPIQSIEIIAFAINVFVYKCYFLL